MIHPVVTQKIDLEKIKRLRKAKGISLEDMASALGYKSPTGYYYLEIGRCAIDANHLPIIAQMVGISDIRELYAATQSTKMVG